ncbi:MAG: hypothetical protein Kow006_33140 [Gammaproteobacteria bacterium]
MDKEDLLKKIGFSQKYLDALDEFSRAGIGEFKHTSNVVSDMLRCNTSDTSELSVNKIILQSSTSLSINNKNT